MVGWPGAAWHLELVGDPDGDPPAAPTAEDLLVLYVSGEADENPVRRLGRGRRYQGGIAIRSGTAGASR